MTEPLKHLNLPFVERYYTRKKRSGGGGYEPQERDEKKFVESNLRACNDVVLSFQKDREHFGKYFNPMMIFKIELNQAVNESNFSGALKNSGINLISQSPKKDGYWIVTSDDVQLEILKERLIQHGEHDDLKFFLAIDKIYPIPAIEKVGPNLAKDPFNDTECSSVDVEVWKMEPKQLREFLSGLKKYVEANNGEFVDYLDVRNFCLVRLKICKSVLENIIQLKEIAMIDRPMKMKIEMPRNTDISNYQLGTSPPSDAPGILVLDSGILSSHPLLKNAVGDEMVAKKVPLTTRYSLSEENAHGTEVAGIALYGDLRKCVECKQFLPQIWILSSKVMFLDDEQSTTFDEDELLENQLRESVEWITDNYPLCKVVNISFGDTNKRMFDGVRQFNLACYLDELATEYGLIFVVSAGNSINCAGHPYPEYLLDWDSDGAKIIDPASSALSLTVGATVKVADRQKLAVECEGPSPFTCVGPGYNGMIKPELVDDGGGHLDSDNDVLTLNPAWIGEGALFRLVSGTSYSAPKISHYLAQLYLKNPGKSSNFIKALLLSSAEHPQHLPSDIPDYRMDNMDEAQKKLSIYGYGRPNLEKALASDMNRVLLTDDNVIGMDCVRFHYFYLPEEFFRNGDREISITLVYDPLVDKNKAEYFGSILEFHLFKNIQIQDLIHSYAELGVVNDNDEEIIPNNIVRNEIKLYPSVRLRNKGVHQKGSRVYHENPEINAEMPLVLAIINRNKWAPQNYQQKYAVCVKIEHTARVNLYNRAELRNKQRIRISQETGK